MNMRIFYLITSTMMLIFLSFTGILLISNINSIDYGILHSNENYNHADAKIADDSIFSNEKNTHTESEYIPSENKDITTTLSKENITTAQLLEKQVDSSSSNKAGSIYDSNFHKELLSKLLPSQPGFQWVYNGFEEYSHEMTVSSILDVTQKKTYYINGMVRDSSDGENASDLSLVMKYIIEENKLIQEKTEVAMLDSKYISLILIKTPLVVGNYWTETVTKKTGESTTITSKIIEFSYSDTGMRQFVILYSDNNSAYYEKRTIQEETGVIYFEKLLELKENSILASYALCKFEN